MPPLERLTTHLARDQTFAVKASRGHLCDPLKYTWMAALGVALMFTRWPSVTEHPCDSAITNLIVAHTLLQALALGARAVFIGRPVLWSLAYNGEKGVTAMLGKTWPLRQTFWFARHVSQRRDDC
jgi:hypothetical protein